MEEETFASGGGLSHAAGLSAEFLSLLERIQLFLLVDLVKNLPEALLELSTARGNSYGYDVMNKHASSV
jgi:hypothetical protein